MAQSFREVLFAYLESGGHQAIPFRRDPILVTLRHLGDEAMTSKLGDLTTDPSTLATTLVRVFGVSRCRRQGSTDITIAETMDEMLPAEHRLEHIGIMLPERSELGDPSSIDHTTLAQDVQYTDSLAFQCDVRHSVQVAFIGCRSHLDISPQVRDTLIHGDPPPRDTLLHLEGLEDLEVARVIDGRLDPEHVPLVVHLDRVIAYAGLDPSPLRAALEVARHPRRRR